MIAMRGKFLFFLNHRVMTFCCGEGEVEGQVFSSMGFEQGD
jgi:hypothetical protein